MRKVAIVGVEGSGKTVMLSGLGELYSRPDEYGFFLSPKNFQTASYVSEKIARMRRGEWPVATAEDVMQGLDWTLKRRQGDGRRPVDVCEVSCLDFAGEVYRVAFGIRQGDVPADLADEVESLREYIRNADDLIVLINLRDIIVRGVHEPRVQESMWITNEILSYALDVPSGRKAPRATIVLSQADCYADTISACRGPKGVLARYLPHVANNYDWLDIMAVSAVDRTVLDDSGNVVPAPDFSLSQLRMIMDWIQSGLSVGARGGASDLHAVAVDAGEARRREEALQRVVVHAEHGHVVRHGNACRAAHARELRGAQVVAAEDGDGLRQGAQPGAQGGGVGRLHQPVAKPVVRAERPDRLPGRAVFDGGEAAVREAGGEGVAAAVREGDARVAAKGERRVAPRQQVFRREPSDRRVVRDRHAEGHAHACGRGPVDEHRGLQGL